MLIIIETIKLLMINSIQLMKNVINTKSINCDQLQFK